MTPECTVVVPSHDRRASLLRLLASLSAQRVDPQRFDVVVVLDGATDGSDTIDTSQFPFRVRLIDQPRAGQSAARNTGAHATDAPTLLFLDDDMEANPDLVAAHLERAAPDTVVLGDGIVRRGAGATMYDLAVWSWWEDVLQRRSRPGATLTYVDLISFNFSLPRDLFLSVGGFDARFVGYGGEDYELGVRLLRAGARFVVAPQAWAWHHHRGSAARAIAAAREEGRNDVLLGALHPEVRHELRLAQPPPADAAALVRLAGVAPRVVAAVMRFDAARLPLLEAARMRRRWTRAYARLRAVAYWLGVFDALGGRSEVEAFLAAGPAPAREVLDVSPGLPVLPSSLTTTTPRAVDVRVAGVSLGEALVVPGPTGDLRSEIACRLSHHFGDRLWPVLAERRRR